MKLFLILKVICSTFLIQGEALKMFKLRDVHSKNNSAVEILSSFFDDLDDFTICGRFRNPFLAPTLDIWQNIVSIPSTNMWLLGNVLIIDCEKRYDGCNDYYREILGIIKDEKIINNYLDPHTGNKYLSGKSFGASYIENKYHFFPAWKPDDWNTFCATHLSSSQELRMFVNNKMVFQLNDLKLKRKVTKENVFLLNAFSYQKNDYIYPFAGSVTDINIWGRTFGSEEMQAWSDCSNVTSGDFLSWENAKFKFHGEIQSIEIAKDEVCFNTNTNKYMAFDEKMNFIESAKFCEKIGGEIAVAEDLETLQIIQEALSDYREQGVCPPLLYTGELNISCNY